MVLKEYDSELLCKLRLFCTGIVVVLGGSFHFGYQVSLINPLADVLQNFLEDSFNSTHNVKFDSWALKIIWPSVAGQLFTGALLGSLLAPKLIYFMGLKRSILFSSAVLITSFLLSCLSKWTTSAELFIFGRFLSGTGVGMSTTMQTVYLTEISPIQYRGTMGTLTGFANSVGFVIASGMGLPQVFGRENLWPWVYGVETIPSVILVVGMTLFLYESPVLLLKHAREKDAIKCLELYYQKNHASNRLMELVNEALSTSDEQQSFKRLLVSKASRNALLICILLNATVSFSGIMAVSFFGTFLLQGIGFSETGAAIANCFASFSGLFGNLVGSYMIDKVGRRKLLIGGLSILAVLNMLIMMLVFYFKLTRDIRIGYGFLLIFVVFLFIFSLGVGPMAWFIATELCESHNRPWIQSISTSCQYITCFISPLVFFPLYQFVGSLSFMIFIVPLSMCSLYLYFYLPETKGREIKEIVKCLGK